MDVHKELVNLLKKEYDKRKLKNTSYSLRSFARFLEVDQSVLSKVLTRQRNFSFTTWDKCLTKLEVDPSIKDKIYQDWDKENAPEGVCDNNLQLLNSWKCWAVIEFLKVNSFSSHKQIADNLGIQIDEVNEIVSYLIEQKFLSKEEGEYVLLRPDNQWFSKTNTSADRRQLQKQFLKISMDSIDVVPLDKRFHGSLTMAIDPRDLPKLNEQMEKVIRKLGKYANKGSAKEVYQVTVSLFPLKGNYE